MANFHHMEPFKKSTLSPSHSFKKRVITQLAVMLGLSSVLGLSFNASNPIGIHLSSPPPGQRTEIAAATPTGPPRIEKTALESAKVNFENLSIVTWPEVKPLLASGQILLVDVRGKPTYDAGHIPGAVSLQEWGTSQEFADFQRRYGTNTPLVVYCGNAVCPTSAEAAKKLVDQYGYRTVGIMKGGYVEWQKAELGYDPSPTRITWAQAKPLLASGQIVLVDARPKAAYDAGHIPEAISLPEAAPPEQFAAFQKQYGPKTHIIVYCTDTKCAASMRQAIKLVTWYNYQKVQFMPGGYQEWQQTELGGAQH